MGRLRVRTLMREGGLQAIQPRAYKPKTTDSNHGKLASENLLKQAENQPSSWGEAIVGDITYLPLRGGKHCYLAMFQDKCTRRVVGWDVAERMTADLVVRSLQMALRRGLINRNAIIHTDQGSQYASNEFRQLLARCSLRQSMSGRGNCYDNAQAESFFSRFKAELVEGGTFENAGQARSEIFGYIEGYYNRKRLHSSIGYLSPIEFERRLRIDNKNKMSQLKLQPVKQTRAMLASNPPRNNRPQTHQQ
jgi:transposase InsO family protein